MKVSKYWSKEKRSARGRDGHEYDLTCWAGSADGPLEAQQNAREKIERWIGKLARGEDIGEYEYQIGEIREELIEEILGADGALIGAVTRNRYGALVLNAASVLIADIDVPAPGPLDRLLALFGRKARDKAWHLEALRGFSADHPEHHLMIYETHSGLRVFVTSQEADPQSENSRTLLATLRSDSLYQRLCHAQKCYRARLTPKPWRCAAERPPNSFPRERFEQQTAFDAWLTTYTEKSRSYTVCRLLASIGSGRITDQAGKILAIHDARAVLHGVEALA